MDTRDQITEEQAISLAGVSARTLQRFCESGYLVTTRGSDGAVLYLRGQIKEIFGGQDDGENLEPESTSTSTYYTDVCSTSDTETNCASAHEPATPLIMNAVVSAEAPSMDQAPAASSAERQRMEVEIERLKNLLAIQERMLDAKDDEISDLKNQRAWLRQRIEKLEEKSDRDQILLLSETQTIRSLLAYQESKKSTFKQFLEWLGVAPKGDLTVIGQTAAQSPQHVAPTSGKTIEVRRTANAD